MAARVLAAQAAYLERLGLVAEPPSADALFRLHRAHVERIPYETLWIHLGETWGVGLDESVERIANRRRGGYCFHLNGAFSELLGSLGYTVARHVGGVHGPAGPTAADLTNHLVLTVHDLPSGANPDGDWYVDAGLGDALHEPLPLPRASTARGRSASRSRRLRVLPATGTSHTIRPAGSPACRGGRRERVSTTSPIAIGGSRLRRSRGS